MPIITAVCPEIHNEEVARQIKAEQTNLLYRFGWGADWPSALVACLITWVAYGTDAQRTLIGAAVFLGGAGISRASLGYAFQRKTIQVEQSLPWQRASLAATVLLGLGWGITGLLLMRTDSWPAAVLPALLLCSVAAAAIPLLSASMLHYLCFTVLALVRSACSDAPTPQNFA